MFPEYRDLITKLKNEDAHFARLFDKHNEIDQEANIEFATQQEVETLKKEKLKIKDELYTILRKYSAK